MLQSLRRLGLAVLFVPALAVSSEAALINISETAGSGSGTLVHDGQTDVGSNNGGGSGDALLLSQFGITDANLVGDLSMLTISGTFFDNAIFGGGPATSVDLSTLWLIGTLDGNPVPDCPTCGFLNDVNVFSALSLPNGDQQNVLFAFAIVGTFPSDPLTLWEGPDNPANSGIIPIPPGTVTYSLSSQQIAFIAARMNDLGFGVDDVRLGLSVVAEGLVGTTGTTDIGSGWDIQGPAVAPEPATILLLGTGLVAAGARRLRRRYRH